MFMANVASALVSMRYGAKGPNYCTVSACATSGHAVGDALRIIQHGEADLRVPISQSYELYNALKRQAVPAKMVVYPRQPHGIQEPKLMLDAMTRNVEWFDRWVMGKK